MEKEREIESIIVTQSDQEEELKEKTSLNHEPWFKLY